MKRLLAALVGFLLIAATPQEALTGLEAEGYYIEEGSDASETVVSNAVFDGRAEGGRLYVVVLAEEPPGGAPTFSDSVLDLLGGDGYVLTVAPETVGWAGDGSFWSSDEMNAAVDASLDASSDSEVVQQFVSSLTGRQAGGGEDQSDGTGDSSSGGFPVLWVLVIGGALLGIWVFTSRRRRERRMAARMEDVKRLANEKLDEVANDIIEMEDEVAVADNDEVKGHYQRASAMYSRAMEDTARATSIKEMLEVTEELDLAIFELDCAEALLDGKPMPDKPQPPPDEPVTPAPTPEGSPTPSRMPPGRPDLFDRRPQRQSSSSNEMMTMLMTMMAMGGMRGRGGFGGGFGGWTGGGRMGGGSSRMGGGGRMRGGGRRGG